MSELLGFLTELSRHNYREWFYENKSRYDVLRATFINDVERLVALLAARDPELQGLQAKT